MINDINERVQQVLAHTKEYIQRFHEFSHLWEDDKKEYLNQFLKYGRQLTQEEIDAKFAGLEIPEKEPTLDQFREVVRKLCYLRLQHRINLFTTPGKHLLTWNNCFFFSD